MDCATGLSVCIKQILLLLHCKLQWKCTLFGGKGDNSAYTLDIAVQFDGTWSEIGKLKAPRYQHRSIANGNSIMHVGGFGSQHFEEWTPSGSSWNIKNWSATLYYYNMYPELFTV